MPRRPPPLNPGAKAWTPAEDAILRARYKRYGAEAMATALGRSISSINHRTQALKLFTHRRWTAEDDRRLRVIWGEMPLAAAAKVLGRSQATTYWRATKLGLPLGVGQGLEFLTAAAARAGYSTGSLRIILRWAGVKLRVTMALPRESGRRFHAVDPLDVDEAVEAWLKTETLRTAAERRGIAAETLERYLIESGLELPPKPDGKGHWRVPTETIDAAVAMRRGKENLRQAAMRLGVSAHTLRHRAIRSGVPRPPGKLWLVPVGALDALAVKRWRRAA